MRCGPNRCPGCGGECGKHSELCPKTQQRDRERLAHEKQMKREKAIDEMLEWFEKNKEKLYTVLWGVR